MRLQTDAAYVVAEVCVAQTQWQLALAAVVRRIELGVALMEAVIVHDGCIHTCNDHEAPDSADLILQVRVHNDVGA